MVTATLLQLALGFMAALVAASYPAVVDWVKTKTHSSALAAAADVGGHVAYGTLAAAAQAASGTGDFQAAKTAAIAAGIAAVRTTSLPALAKLSDPAIAAAVESGLGAALKADTGISALPAPASLAMATALFHGEAPIWAGVPANDTSALAIPSAPSQAAALPVVTITASADPASATAAALQDVAKAVAAALPASQATKRIENTLQEDGSLKVVETPIDRPAAAPAVEPAESAPEPVAAETKG